MRFFLIGLSIALAMSVASEAQTVRAITQDGRTVVLYPDGTWVDADSVRTTEVIELDLSGPPPPAPPPPPMSRRPAEGTLRTVQGGGGIYSIRYDAGEWRSVPNQLNVDAEHEFELPFGAGYAVTIYEVTPYPLDVMRELILSNAEEGTGGYLREVAEDTVQVEGGEVLRLEFQVVTPEGLDFTFISSVHTGPYGALQVVTWCATPIVERFRDKLIAFQNGLVLHPENAE